MLLRGYLLSLGLYLWLDDLGGMGGSEHRFSCGTQGMDK